MGEKENKNRQRLKRKMTVIFCHECNNMLYPKADKRTKQLMHCCRNCGYSLKADDPCIYASQPNQINELERINVDLVNDPTLSRTSKESPITCPNPICSSVTAVYMQTVSPCPRSKMNLYYVCCKCRQKWTYDNQQLIMP